MTNEIASLNSLEPPVRTIVLQLRRIPDWAGGCWIENYEDRTVDASVVIDVSKNLEYANTSDLKQAINYMLQHNIDDWGRVYLFLRVFFDVSDAVPYANAKCFGSWIRPQFDSEKKEISYNALWPLFKKDDGTLRIHSCQGYCGTSYDALGEMEYFIDLRKNR